MPKRVFWPATLVTMGLIFLASNLGLLPTRFWNFWPLMLIIIGLGGLVISDREEWMAGPSRAVRSTAKATPAKKSAPKKKTRT